MLLATSASSSRVIPTLNGHPICRNLLVDAKDVIVSFTKSREAITGTINKLQIPALTYKGHCISSTAMPSANDATLQSCAASK